MSVSGWFLSFPLFLFHCNKTLEQQTTGFKTTDKLQLSSVKEDRSFVRQTVPRHGSR